MNPKRSKKQYRPDIDGLRALAVIPVILFHLEINGFSGGYVGVDIFFVISGYLITSILLREMRKDTFSLCHFWERRMRRIVPALFVVLICTAIASYYIILFPIDFKDFGWTLIAQGIFMANLWFMRTDGYFAAPSESIPLLHTWSLAVEEQFYFIFPILLLVIFSFCRKKIVFVLSFLFLLSLGYSVTLLSAPTDRFTLPLLPHLWGGATQATAAFYFILPRAWELLIGAIIAAGNYAIVNKNIANVTAAISLAAIVFAITQFDETSTFPGLLALLPTMATAGLIVTGSTHKTFVNTFLAYPIFVGIGLLSYSLYLWHWPILVLYKQFNAITTLHSSDVMLILLFTFTASYITYRFVEIPFATKRYCSKRNNMLLVGSLLLFTTISIGIYIVHKNGLPERAPAAAQIIAAAAVDFNPRRDECFKKSIADITKGKSLCLLGQQEPQAVSYVLWGDSHADAVMPAFDTYGQEIGATGAFFGVGGCAPLLTPTPITTDENCREEKKRALDFIKQTQPTEIFLVSEWKDGYTHVGDTKGIFLSDALTYTINQFPPETKVTILKKIPTYQDFDVRAVFNTLLRTSMTLRHEAPRHYHDEAVASIHTQIDHLTTTQLKITSLDPADTLCDEKNCFMQNDTVAHYRDGSHLTQQAALTFILPLLHNR